MLFRTSQFSITQLLLSCLSLALVGLFWPNPARAADFPVACADVPGLISAINNANANAENDSITLADNCTYSLTAIDNAPAYPGANGLPSITSAITIVGNGAIIQRDAGAPAMRIFYVESGGSLTMQNLSLMNGQTAGAAVFNEGLLTIVGSTIGNNSGGSAGALENYGALTIDQSTFTDNSASGGKGGALYTSGTVTITRSSFLTNSAQDGGAIYAHEGAVISIGNSTFSGNTATAASGDGGGGALVTVLFAPDFAPDVTIVNSTFSGNSAFSGGAIKVGFGSVTLQNTILTDSPAGGNCAGSAFFGIPRNTTSLGHNLSSDGTCGGDASDLINTDPLLDSLADNGGATQTLALLPGSPAIDAGDAGACAAAPINDIDQRGVSRPQGASCDMGAFEYSSTLLVTNTNDGGAGSLRQAILYANEIAGLDTIHFNIPGSGPHTIQPNSALPLITDPVFIDGYTQPGASTNTLE